MDTHHIQGLVRMRDEIAESGSADEPVSKVGFDDPVVLEAPEGVRVAARSSQAQRQASSHREVDHDLRRLPEMEHNGIRRIGRGSEIAGRGGQSVRHAVETTLNRHDAFGEDGSVEGGQGYRASRVCS